MTYGLKVVRFKGRDCYILLQNENGPCPLLAASNGLILQGKIELPLSSRRIREATLDDVANMLADFAMQTIQTHTKSNTEVRKTTTPNSKLSDPMGIDETNNERQQTKPVQQQPQWTLSSSLIPTIAILPNNIVGDHGERRNNVATPSSTSTDVPPTPSKTNDNCANVNQNVYREPEDGYEESIFLINELMQYIPKFQYGMDVNPKFTEGITGYEYTAELTAFDLLRIKLVHGWLVNPYDNQSKELYQAIGRRSYNECIDMIIDYKGKDVELSNLLNQIDHILNTMNGNNYNEVKEHHIELMELQSKYDTLSKRIHDMMIIDDFINNVASHQLTIYGLELLHDDIKDDEICVLFRNNHFNTLYKHPISKSLYILITDYGYGNTPNIIWEKLDVIDGDTEFCNDQFQANYVKSNNNDNVEMNATTNGTAIHNIGTDNDEHEADLKLAVKLSMTSVAATQIQSPQPQGQHPSPMPQKDPSILFADETPVEHSSISHCQTATEDADRMLAMQLQEHDKDYVSTVGGRTTSLSINPYGNDDRYRLDDFHEESIRLAIQLQEEEDRIAAQAVQRAATTIAQQRTTSTPVNRNPNINNNNSRVDNRVNVTNSNNNATDKCTIM